MTRDEILDAIKRASTEPEDYERRYLDEVESRMRDVARLADTYLEEGAGEIQYLAEAMATAMERFADMLRSAP